MKLFISFAQQHTYQKRDEDNKTNPLKSSGQRNVLFC
jgi:hypothetical protein